MQGRAVSTIIRDLLVATTPITKHAPVVSPNAPADRIARAQQSIRRGPVQNHHVTEALTEIFAGYELDADRVEKSGRHFVDIAVNRAILPIQFVICSDAAG